MLTLTTFIVNDSTGLATRQQVRVYSPDNIGQHSAGEADDAPGGVVIGGLLVMGAVALGARAVLRRAS
jgi:MYXO-CTERM domain-containing protein